MRHRSKRGREGNVNGRPPRIDTEEEAKDKRHGRCGVIGLFALYHVLVVLGAVWWVFSTCEPLGLDAPKSAFSEARALTHVDVLSKRIGFRQISSPGLKEGGAYIKQQCEHLATLATKSGQFSAQVDVEDVSGALNDVIFNTPVTNAYRNLTNILLYISPKGAEGKKALLVNSHYDSTYGSPGASDCAACVAIGLEIARAIVEEGKDIQTPILFLFNGGEETIMQAADGFMKMSKWLPRVGAFINLESTGSGGFPLVFQYSGLWTMEAFVRGAKHPRGSVIAQDFYNMKLIPADTDFRMLSADHRGSLPGIDMATVLDAAAYHTDRDTLERIRPGTTQEYGETATGVVDELLRAMADGVPDDGEHKNEKAVYFDGFHTWMVLYTMDTAMKIHSLPLVLIGVAYFLRRSEVDGIPLRGLGSFQLKWGFAGVLIGILSLLLAILLPMAFGAAWVYFTGRAMFWFSTHYPAYLTYGSMSVIGMMLPWQTNSHHIKISSSLLGLCVLLGGVGLHLTKAGFGSSYEFSLLSLFGACVAMFIPMKLYSPFRAIPALVMAALPALGCLTMGLAFTEHLLDKISLMGVGHPVWGIYTPDLGIAGLVGFTVFLSTTLLMPYFVGVLNTWQKRSIIAGLFGVSLVSAGLLGFNSPFSVYRPRRVQLKHIHETTGASPSAYYSLSAWEPLPIHTILPKSFDTEKMLDKTDSRPSIVMFPLHKHTRCYYFEAPVTSTKPWGATPPKLHKVKHEDAGDSTARRLFLELHWEKPGWGVMNMTGPILGWSLTDSVAKSVREDGGVDHVIRFNQDAEEPVWPFWVDVPSGEELRIEMGISYFAETAELNAIVAEIPDWTSIATATVALSKWTFS
ncbi:hypothetical protein BSKO_11323 [Bryopsis sp. KO-2023]|nr:hypothetical protein BSKO_11323 [Bryopsis sp. KO-2023]